MAVIRFLHLIQNYILHYYSDSFQYEGHEQMNMDVVPGAMEFPRKKEQGQKQNEWVAEAMAINFREAPFI